MMKIGNIVLVDPDTDQEREGRVSAIGRGSVSVQFPNENDPSTPYEQTFDLWRVFDVTFNSELTDAGEQTVIPGCERNQSPTGPKQMDLFG